MRNYKIENGKYLTFTDENNHINKIDLDKLFPQPIKYDETLKRRHPKRNRAQNKMIKQMIYHLDLMFGQNNAGMFLAMVLDALDKMMNETTPDTYIELRTIEIKFNDFYSVKLDCKTGEYVK